MITPIAAAGGTAMRRPTKPNRKPNAAIANISQTEIEVFVLIVKKLVLKVRPGKGVRTLGQFIVAIALTALGAALLHGLEAAAWAILYIWVGALPDAHAAMLYSLSAITSYGHSNIFLEDRWRLLGAIEAMNGLILFGLTTAFLFAAIEEVWPVRRR
jgi:hypothetical protein